MDADAARRDTRRGAAQELPAQALHQQKPRKGMLRRRLGEGRPRGYRRLLRRRRRTESLASAAAARRYPRDMNNIAEICAIFHAFCAARNSPLDVCSDSALALRTASGEATSALAPPGAAGASMHGDPAPSRRGDVVKCVTAPRTSRAITWPTRLPRPAPSARELFVVPEGRLSSAGLGTWLAIPAQASCRCLGAPGTRRGWSITGV